MAEVNQLAILKDIYGPQLDVHHDIYQKSVAHRKEHGESECDVYPSTAIGPMWVLLAAMLPATRFLEVGCGLGYNATLMAEAGGPSASVDTIENSSLHADLAEQEISRVGLAGRIKVLRGEATQVLPDLTGPYDVVFVDADWEDYPKWLEDFARLTRQGGMLLSHNLFPLFEEWAQYLLHKESIQEYLTALVHDERFKTHIVRDKWEALSYRV